LRCAVPEGTALKTLEFARSLALSVGMALASSCLAMVADMSARAGAWVLLAIGASALLALVVARAIGQLARRFPSALGVRTYVKAAFGNRASLFVVFVYLVMIVAVACVESQLYAAIVQQLMPASDARWTLLGVFAAVFFINRLGAEASRNAQLLLVLLMLGGLAALSLHSLWRAGPAMWTAAAQPAQLMALPTVTVMAFFLFVGFEWVTSSQPASRQAAAQLPRVLWVAVLVLATAYLLFAAAALVQLGSAGLADTRTPQLLMAAQLWGEPGRWLMLGVATAAVLMAFNAGVLGASRLLYSLAREGCLPRWLAQADARRAVPVRAIAVTVGTAAACSLAAQALHASSVLGGAAAVLIVLCYGSLLAANLRLAQREGASAQARRLDTAALLAMAGLLAATTCDPAAWRATALAALGCAACGLLAWRLARSPALPQPAPPARGHAA
jgi:ethanolamine permease